MYKVGQKASRTSQLPSSIARTAAPSVSQRTALTLKAAPKQTIYNKQQQLGAASILGSDMVIPIFALRKKKNRSVNSPPTTPSSPILEEQITFLNNSWKSFCETPSGEPDAKIVEYKPEASKCPSEEDFVPFNIDQFLMEKILKEVDIDPKILLL